MSKLRKPKKLRKIIALIVSILFLLLVLIILDEEQKNNLQEKYESSINQNPKLRPTSVIEVFPKKTHVIIKAYGEIKPKYKTSIKAKTQGKIIEISNQIQVGKRINKGEVLYRFDRSNNQTQISDAKNQIAQAELLLKTEEKLAKQAKFDWKIAHKSNKQSDYALRIPQIKAAQTQLILAKNKLKEIKLHEPFSTIKAPYNGIVVSSSANLGDVVNNGQVLAVIVSSENLDVAIQLDDKQWNNLIANWQGSKAVIKVIDNKSSKTRSPKQWQAIIDRDGGIIDEKSRMHSLFLKVDSEDKPILGSFIQVEIIGKEIQNILEIPITALTPQGRVWLVNNKNELSYMQTDAIYSKNNFVYVENNSRQINQSFLIAINPLTTFIPGLKVKPIMQGNQ